MRHGNWSLHVNEMFPRRSHNHTRFFPRCFHIECEGKNWKKNLNVDENKVSCVSVVVENEDGFLMSRTTDVICIAFMGKPFSETTLPSPWNNFAPILFFSSPIRKCEVAWSNKKINCLRKRNVFFYTWHKENCCFFSYFLFCQREKKVSLLTKSFIWNMLKTHLLNL